MAAMPVGAGSPARPLHDERREGEEDTADDATADGGCNHQELWEPSSMRESHVGGRHRGDVDSGKLL